MNITSHFSSSTAQNFSSTKELLQNNSIAIVWYIVEEDSHD